MARIWTARMPLLPTRCHTLQAASSQRLAELQGEAQVLRFEKERTGMVHQETLTELRHLQLQQEKLHKKVCVCVWPLVALSC